MKLLTILMTLAFIIKPFSLNGSVQNINFSSYDSSSALSDDSFRQGVLWEPYMEWELAVSVYNGNPYDIIAKVIFTHERSGESIETGMFYDGNSKWKFRFTGVRTGLWTYQTYSKVGGLDGYSGRIFVEPNPDLSARGFISARGNKFIRQGPTEHDSDAFIPNVWINYRKWGNPERAGWTDISSAFADSSMVDAFLEDAREHGMNGIQAIVANQWFTKDVARWDQIDNENPDPSTFRALENAIIQAHKHGMFIHIWVWGDEERRWTPTGLTGGINGEADRRIQRYIAARLGPLPGWTMSYGFDLREWVSAGEVAEWVDFMHDHLGWPHLLGARESRQILFPDGTVSQPQGIVPTESFFASPDNTGFLSHDLRPTDNFYDNAQKLREYANNRPLFLERRFTFLRDGVWDTETTRRALWQFAMAGGTGAIWGFFPPGSSPYMEGEYNKEQLVNYDEFWSGRFLLDMEPDNDPGKGAWVLRNGKSHLIFYQEDTDHVQMDLTSAGSQLRAIAVDTKSNYSEIDIGMLGPGEHKWKAPYFSDWAIAVGRFNTETGSPVKSRLRISPDNPRYLEYGGEPLIIASKTFGWTMPGNVYFDHAKDIITARENGGNLLRLTLFWPGQGDYYDLALPWVKDRETGLYDLDLFNETYFKRLKYVLALARHHDLIVNLEIWDTPAVKDRPTRWPSHPMNPLNNINYDDDQLPAGSAEKLFFRTLPDLDNKSVALHYQQRLLEKILEVSLPYGNIIYSIGNEDRSPEEWRGYWTQFIREYARDYGFGEVLITNMADRDSPLYDVIDTQDTHAPYRVRRSSPRELHETYRLYMERDRIKPVFDSAQMIAADMDNYFRPYYHLWIPFISGGAGVRFHRAAPYPATMRAHGGGFYESLGEMRTGEYKGESYREHPFYIEQLRWVNNFRSFTERIEFWTMHPLLDMVSDGEAYGFGRIGEEYIFYAHNTGEFSITGHGMSGEYYGYWYNPDTGEASGHFQFPADPGQPIKFKVPGGGSEYDMVLHLKNR